jgi:predicted aldo/keto reductase-like oxidoreductase
MQYNRIGKTDLQVSVVGFGTCQLRLVPAQQAIDTLKRGFELGVNWVHTAPDYEGADDLVARAIAESGHDVMAFSQGYGDMAHFEYLFDSTCRKFHKTRLEMFGIACIEDREVLGEPVWGAGGMIDFLVRKKREGRLGGIFCTTHGAPDYVRRLITSGYFDAVMLAYNPLGFHLLSYDPKGSKPYEDMPKTREQIFPLAVEHRVGLLIMKPLAGGLLCASKAFPPHQRFSKEAVKLTATEILGDILRHPGVCAVVPGTASVEEAEENARAGHRPIEHAPERLGAIEHAVDEMRASLCSRCGHCDSLCSQSLPVSWLFRDAYISNYPSETFETTRMLQRLVVPARISLATARTTSISQASSAASSSRWCR